MQYYTFLEYLTFCECFYGKSSPLIDFNAEAEMCLLQTKEKYICMYVYEEIILHAYKLVKSSVNKFNGSSPGFLKFTKKYLSQYTIHILVALF